MSDGFGTDDADGWLGGIVADEDDLDRRTLWRLGLWGVAAVGALTLGLMSGQLPVNAQRTQLAASELSGRAQKVEATIQENQLEARRLAAAIETLNGDRDRLFSRLSSLEQGLDVVTGSIRKTEDGPKDDPKENSKENSKESSKENSKAVAWPDAAVAPVVDSAPATFASPLPGSPVPAPVASAPAREPEHATTAVAARSEPPPAEIASPAPAPTPAASRSVIQAMPIADPQPAPTETTEKPPEESAVALAEFGVDLGAANSISGLRALWRGLARSHKTQLDGLRPLIAVRERRNGLGLQLRLVAGPIRDAAAAARICAVLSNAERNCKTTSFDGQRLSLSAEPEEKAAPARARPPAKRKSTRAPQPPAPAAATRAAQASSISTLLGIR